MITINGKTMDLEFTYNSTKYLSDFDLTLFDQMEAKPFKSLELVTGLLYASMNSSKHTKVSLDEVDDVIESAVNEGKFSELLEELVKKLQESAFFQSLQKNQPKNKKK
jgi:hypothetical protein